MEPRLGGGCKRRRSFAGSRPLSRGLAPERGHAPAHVGYGACEGCGRGHRQGGGQRPWARPAAPPQLWPRQGAGCGRWPSPGTEGRAPLAAEPPLRGLPGLRLQATGGRPGAQPHPRLPFERAAPGSPSTRGKQLRRCAWPLIAQLLPLRTTGLWTCGAGPGGGARVSGAGNTLRRTPPPPQLRLGGKRPQSGSGDGTVGRHPDPPPGPMGPWAWRGQAWSP